jgi:hypothetical protein
VHRAGRRVGGDAVSRWLWGGKAGAPKTMRLSDVPAAFMETARKELPDVDFDEVWVKKDGTLEIRGKAKNGKVREIEIRPDGTVEEIE